MTAADGVGVNYVTALRKMQRTTQVKVLSVTSLKNTDNYG